jgi:hypothetical protein
MNNIEIAVDDKNFRLEIFKFLNIISKKLKSESVINVTMVTGNLISTSDIEKIFTGHSILWFLNKGINIDSDFTTSFNVESDLFVSMVITAGNDNYMIIKNNIATGVIGDIECTGAVYNIAKTILRLST